MCKMILVTLLCPNYMFLQYLSVALCKQTVQSDLTARLSSARWWVTTILIKMMQ